MQREHRLEPTHRSGDSGESGAAWSPCPFFPAAELGPASPILQPSKRAESRRSSESFNWLLVGGPGNEIQKHVQQTKGRSWQDERVKLKGKVVVWSCCRARVTSHGRGRHGHRGWEPTGSRRRPTRGSWTTEQKASRVLATCREGSLWLYCPGCPCCLWFPEVSVRRPPRRPGFCTASGVYTQAAHVRVHW